MLTHTHNAVRGRSNMISRLKKGGGGGVASWKSDITPFENEDFLNIPTNFQFSSLIYSMLPIAYKSRLDLHLSFRIITNL